MLCKSCQFDLSHLFHEPHRCPECGRDFDPNDSSTFDSGRLPPASRAAIRIVIIVLATFALAAAAIAILIFFLFSSAFKNFHP